MVCVPAGRAGRRAAAGQLSIFRLAVRLSCPAECAGVSGHCGHFGDTGVPGSAHLDLLCGGGQGAETRGAAAGQPALPPVRRLPLRLLDRLAHDGEVRSGQHQHLTVPVPRLHRLLSALPHGHVRPIRPAQPGTSPEAAEAGLHRGAGLRAERLPGDPPAGGAHRPGHSAVTVQPQRQAHPLRRPRTGRERAGRGGHGRLRQGAWSGAGTNYYGRKLHGYPGKSDVFPLFDDR